MSDLHSRIERLSPERRELLEQLRQPPVTMRAAVLDTTAERGSIRDYYDRVNLQLSASRFADEALFLNYGYAPLDDAPPPREYPRSPVNQHSVRLVLELLGNLELTSAERVVDVGCGRGGTLTVLRRLFPALELLGCDLSPRAIEFCARRHRATGLGFVVADAGKLPFPDRFFGLVTNVESSHSYPSLEGFLREVMRVLRPAGHFLYTDLLSPSRIAEFEQMFATLGLELQHRRDITANVLLACDLSAARKVAAYVPTNDAAAVRRLVGAPGSEPYRAMRAGDLVYMLYRLTSPGSQ